MAVEKARGGSIDHSDRLHVPNEKLGHNEPITAQYLEKVAEERGLGKQSGLVVDIEEAKREFGDEIASRLKVAHDGKTVLWPRECAGHARSTGLKYSPQNPPTARMTR